MRWVRGVLIALLTVLGLGFAAVASVRWLYFGPLPSVEIPSGAAHVDCRAGFLGFYRSCSFELDRPYPSISVVQSVGQSLEAKGWTALSAAGDDWVTNSWQRFLDGTTSPERFVNQYTAAWRSPDGRHRVLLGLRYYEGKTGLQSTTCQAALWVESSFASSSAR